MPERLMAARLLRGFLVLNQPYFEGITGQTGHVVQIQLPHEVSPMVVHCLYADSQFDRNFLGPTL